MGKNILIGIVVLNMALCALIKKVEAKTFFVTPTSSTLCPPPCYTLSHYATNPEVFSNYADIDLALLPGEHFLTSDLSITGRENFTLSVTNSSSETSITCSESAKLSIVSVGIVQVVGVQFYGCVKNRFVSVEQFRIDKCSLFGKEHNGTALELVSVNNASITLTNLTSFNYNSYINKSELNITDTPCGGAVFLVNTTVFISGCIFEGNTAILGGAICSHTGEMTISKCQFNRNRAVSGGLGGALFITQYYTCSKNAIVDSDFYANTARTGGAIYLTTLDTVTISNTILLENEAIIGGTFFMRSINEINISGSQILNSRGVLGGALYIELVNLLFRSLNFENNKGNTSMYIVRSNITIVGNTRIVNNTGSVLMFASNATFLGNTSFERNSPANSTLRFQEGGAITSFRSIVFFVNTTSFIDNNAKSGGAILARESTLYMYETITVSHNSADRFGGGIYLYQTDLSFDKNAAAEISNNYAFKGGGIYAVSATITINDGTVDFVKNIAKSHGGGIDLELNARIYIAKQQAECKDTFLGLCNTKEYTWIKLNFVENTADYGGAIYVTDNTTSGTCASIPSSTQTNTAECFIQTLPLYVIYYRLASFNFRNVYFSNNSAHTAGKTLYGGLLDRCTASPFSEYIQTYPGPTVNVGLPYFLNITNISKEEAKQQIQSEPVRICFCENNMPNCDYKPATMTIRRGQTFKVSLVAVDQVVNVVPSCIVPLLSDRAFLEKNQSKQSTKNDCTELKYNVYSPVEKELLTLYPIGPCGSTGISKVSINIIFLPCPLGFVTSDSGSECMCDPVLQNFIANCSVDTGLVSRTGNVWVSVVDVTNRIYVSYSNCPFDYCHSSEEKIFINLNVENGSDAQCQFNQTGILCGACDQNAGLSHTFGGSRCWLCTDNWLALIVLFALAGVALVSFLLVCNLTVAVGTINGLIFYANIVSANRAIFLPFDSPNLLSTFIAWINLDFGFETCFYNGMDEYAKAWLQLVFPFYIICLVALIIIVSQYSQRFSKLLSKRNPVATLATLVLLTFTKLVRTVIGALSYATLTIHGNSSNYSKVVWLFDGNIPYLKGKHIPLFIAAIIIIFVTLAYTLLLFFWQWLVRCPNRKALKWIQDVRLKGIMDTYHAPYNTQHRYWTGLLLVVRAVLYLISALDFYHSSDPKLPLFCTLIAIGGLLSLRDIAVKSRIYNSWPLNALEGAFLYNLLCFTAFTLYIKASGGNQIALAYTSTGVAFVMFLAVLLYHTYAYILASFKPCHKLQAFFKSKKREAHFSNTYNGEKDHLLAKNQQNPFSTLRAPLELIESQSFAEHDYNTTQNDNTRYKHERVVTHTVVDAIPCEMEESDQTLTKM